MDHDINNDGTLKSNRIRWKLVVRTLHFDEYAKIETGRDGGVTVNWEYDILMITKTVIKNYDI